MAVVLVPRPPPQAAVEELEGLRTEMRATEESLRRAPELGTADLIPSRPSVVPPLVNGEGSFAANVNGGLFKKKHKAARDPS